MRILRKLLIVCVLVPMILTTTVAAQVEPKTYLFGIEINDVLCGYADVQVGMARVVPNQHQNLAWTRGPVNYR